MEKTNIIGKSLLYRKRRKQKIKSRTRGLFFALLFCLKDNRDNRYNPFLLPVSACKQGKKLSLLSLLSLNLRKQRPPTSSTFLYIFFRNPRHVLAEPGGVTRGTPIRSDMPQRAMLPSKLLNKSRLFSHIKHVLSFGGTAGSSARAFFISACLFL